MSSEFLSSEQKEYILSHIPEQGITALQLSNITGFDRKVINNLLYGLENSRVSKYIPQNLVRPIWKLLPQTNNNVETKTTTDNKIDSTKNIGMKIKIKTEKIPTLILIDLGNVHDCLQKLESSKSVIIGYCNYTYNGYGVSEPYENENISIKRFDSKDKNVVISEMFFSVSTVLTSKIKTNIIVVSKSNCFTYLPELAKNHGKELKLATDWSSLKPLL